MMPPNRRRWLLHGAAIAAATAPAAVLAVRAATTGLGANPIEEITHASGDWTLRLLLATLAVTPARRLLGWPALAPLRRTLGLAAFAWGCTHVATWVALDHFFDWRSIAEDVLERRYVTAGMAGFLCLLPLALTSTRRWQRRLGRRWVRLHRLAYVAPVCGVVHYVWLVKADLLAPLVHAALLAALLGLRLARPLASRASQEELVRPLGPRIR
jgi:sulfoxide reductase heme-binding subunit YedZ